MQTKDITPGATYAYASSRHDRPRRIVFLTDATADHLHTATRDRRAYTTATPASKPRIGDHMRPPVGWPVAYLSDDANSADATIAAFCDSTVNISRDGTPRGLAPGNGIQYGLVCAARFVLGDWDKHVADKKAAAEEARRHAEEQEAHKRAETDRVLDLMATLTLYGIDAFSRDDYMTGHRVLCLELDEVDKLIERLRAR